MGTILKILNTHEHPVSPMDNELSQPRKLSKKGQRDVQSQYSTRLSLPSNPNAGNSLSGKQPRHGPRSFPTNAFLPSPQRSKTLPTGYELWEIGLPRWLFCAQRRGYNHAVFGQNVRDFLEGCKTRGKVNIGASYLDQRHLRYSDFR